VGVEILSDARWWDIYTDSEYLAFAELVLASESLGMGYILIGYGAHNAHRLCSSLVVHAKERSQREPSN